MRWSADSFAPKDHARGVNMGDPRRFRLHVQRGNSGGLFRMDLPTQSWRASWLAAGDRLIKALGISSHSRGSGCSQVDLDPRPTPVRHQLRHPMRPQDDRLPGRVPAGTVSHLEADELPNTDDLWGPGSPAVMQGGRPAGSQGLTSRMTRPLKRPMKVGRIL
jgi:hypothetical protein